MARAFQQSQPIEDEASGDWQSLRSELVALLDQVEGRVAQTRREPSLSERVRDLRYQVADVEPDARHRDALKTVQRQISRFEEPPAAPQMPPNPRDTLQAAINQIRARQAEQQRAPAPQAPLPSRPTDGPMLERLAQAITALSGRLERLEGEIRTQVKTGANVKDVADQVAQLAHVVELLAGAVGETGQVKRLEGQIASLGKIMAQGREMDISTLTRRLDDVASTVGKLAELQVHYADRVQNPVETQAFADGMASIEQSVRAVYDRIDSLERQRAVSPEDLDHVTAEMARFTEALNEGQPHNLIGLVDALNTRVSDMESGDRMLHGLRKDLSALRDSVIVSLTPRFDAIEQRIGSLGDAMSTREDMAEIGRQIGALGDRIGERPIDPGLGQLEAQVRQLVARMDQTGEQLSGLAKLYTGESAPAAMPDFDAMADMVAARTFEAMQRHSPSDSSLAQTIAGLEGRITTMLQSMHRDPEIADFSPMQAGIAEVNDRLKRLELSLLERNADSGPPAAPATTAAAAAYFSEAPLSFTEPEPEPTPAPMARSDAMPRSPDEDAPLNAPPFPAPVGPVEAALASASRKRHPGLDDDFSLAARYEPETTPERVEPTKVALPPAPQPSPGFLEPEEPTVDDAGEPAAVTPSSRNTFIEAHRRAAQRQATKPEITSNSLIGRALARFHSANEFKPGADVQPRMLAGDKPARTEFKPEPVIDALGAPPRLVEVAAAVKPAKRVKPPKVAKVKAETAAADAAAEGGESFLLRNRKVILLAAAIVTLALLTVNFVAQRAANEQAQTASEPTTTGDISGDVYEPADAPAGAPVLEAPAAPRVIPMVDSLKTGSIDTTAAQGFTTAPITTMPSAFEAATQVANADPSTIAPLTTDLSPVKLELPPEALGPMDLRQAAANGDAKAQFEIAAIYSEGRAVPQDYAAAATWYERAAAQGFAPAQYRLGSLYESGNGVTKDLNTAKLWYERAAEAGNRMSMHNLAALYAGGQLGKQQFDSAAKWFEEAASRGLTDSQFNLGMLYARGLGVPQSLADSFKWFGIAALSGDKDAAKARDDMARSLDADTVNRLTAEVAAFRPAPIDMKANFAPIGTWSQKFDPGETIATRDIVASVQKALTRLGYDVGTPDGIPGPKTAIAIKAFEQATGMSEVGQINPRLLAVLGSQPV